MPAGLSALLNMIGGVGQQLLNAFTYIFGWIFTTGDGGKLTNWPVLISIVFMVLVFIKQFVGHIIHGTH
ncbi:hypothetical protein [Spiroplasma ixodetis]|uniref:hypothetical protein n=1 Tax=Spiroplasma ixodetis TaxID=2141 RepID=UPI0025763C93|nr:hypothetical protein [Spiroplasma ixodetis]WJG70855.1 hypothetical protein SIXOD_v1c21280 [Spiroplasma ixodetis Y32]